MKVTICLFVALLLLLGLSCQTEENCNCPPEVADGVRITWPKDWDTVHVRVDSISIQDGTRQYWLGEAVSVNVETNVPGGPRRARLRYPQGIIGLLYPQSANFSFPLLGESSNRPSMYSPIYCWWGWT